MKLTPETLKATYEYLHALPPFSHWDLPDADEVLFEVVRTKGRSSGECRWHVDDTYGIRIWEKNVHRADDLRAHMAHEMTHLAELIHVRDMGHGTLFKRMARQVCRHHGFKLEDF